jgi:hypothetical protein
MSALSTPRLAALTGRTPEPSPSPLERCELCAEALPPVHRHLLDLADAELMCACGACAVLFDDQAAGGRHYRLIPRKRTALTDLRLDGQLWAALGPPVDLAFFTRRGSTGEVIAHYPSPLGALRAAVPAESWQRLLDLNPRLAGLDTDVEALVVNRAKGATDHWMLPLDDCYRLTAVLREHWTGFSGGSHVWGQIRNFFDELGEERQR